MPTNESDLGRQPEAARSITSAASSALQWRVAVLHGLAGAHLVLGVLELSMVLGNYLLQQEYMGGPIGLLGALTMHIAAFLNSLLLVSPSDPTLFWTKSQWIARSAMSSHDFFVAMVSVHGAVGMFNLALGQGLWRRRSWARQIGIALISVAGFVAAVHGVALVWAGGQLKMFGMMFGDVVLLLPIIVTVPILSFLMLPGTVALFRDCTPDVKIARRRRQWWMLPLQFLAGLLVLALASGILLVINLGPMVEVGWLVIHLVVEMPWF